MKLFNISTLAFLSMAPLFAGALEVADSRMIAYLGNWQACPTAAQLAEYSHIVIAFAVSYTWSPGKNQCSTTCEIATPPVCNNAPNPQLINDLHAQGKKVILSYGGAGMGGSWDGDVNDCWEYCYGREQQVVSRLTEIVNEMNLDGVDIDYEYFYEDNQNGSGFNKGQQAVQFLTQITSGLRNSLAEDAIVTHAPMDVDLLPNTDYYDLLKNAAPSLDFLMPQYYNGVTRPVVDGLGGQGSGSMSAQEHYSTIIFEMFGGDATRMVFGFCIQDCSFTGSNANAFQAATVMTDLSLIYPCNGGAFFWVAKDDNGGAWSSVVNSAMQTNGGNCSGGTSSPVAPTPITPSPTDAPVLASPTGFPTASPVSSPTITVEGDRCCSSGLNGLKAYDGCSKFYYCVNGQVTGDPLPCSSGLLFDEAQQACTWANEVTTCNVDSCGGASTPTPNPTEAPTPNPTMAPTPQPTDASTPNPTSQPTVAPTASPVASPTNAPTASPVANPTDAPTSSPVSSPTTPSGPCCPAGYSGMKQSNSDCSLFHQCLQGQVIAAPQACAPGLKFDPALQVCNWEAAVTCGDPAC
ncbi:MAG: hypothetical protein SGILL_001318 [Bacillariaceae sp.]